MNMKSKNLHKRNPRWLKYNNRPELLNVAYEELKET